MELAEEKAARAQAEVTLHEKVTYINFLESFVSQMARKLGVSGRSKETLDGMVRKVDELLARP